MVLVLSGRCLDGCWLDRPGMETLDGELDDRCCAASASADLAIFKSDAPDPVTSGNSLTYSVRITNIGPSTVTSVTVTDSLPASVTFISATPSQGSSHERGRHGRVYARIALRRRNGGRPGCRDAKHRRNDHQSSNRDQQRDRTHLLNNTATATTTVNAPAKLGVSPISRNFGTVATGTTAQLGFVVTNSGGLVLNGTATVGGISFAIASGSPFSIPPTGSTATSS